MMKTKMQKGRRGFEGLRARARKGMHVRPGKNTRTGTGRACKRRQDPVFRSQNTA